MLTSREQLKKILIEDSEQKKWKYNTFAEIWEEKYKKISQIMPETIRLGGLVGQIDNCPRKRRVWKGKSYANRLNDCGCNCPFLISSFSEKQDNSYNEKHFILCSGKTLISSKEDFRLSYEERKEKYRIYL